MVAGILREAALILLILILIFVPFLILLFGIHQLFEIIKHLFKLTPKEETRAKKENTKA